MAVSGSKASAEALGTALWRLLGRRDWRLDLSELYLTGSEIGFRTNQLAIHQILAVKADEQGRSGLLPTRGDWYGYPDVDRA